jgi:hypothetical protein
MHRFLARIPPVLLALAIQGLSLAALVLVARGVGGLPSPLALAVMCGLLAAAISWFAGLERWWLLIQLCFAPAAWLMLTLQVGRWYFLGLFIALLLVYWSTFRTRVPLYLSGPAVWQAVAALLPPAATIGAPLQVIDIGCGLGGLVMHLARTRPDAVVHGVELAPLPALISLLRSRQLAARNARVSWGSYWQLDLGHYDVVFAFLSPVPMPDLWRKARREMRPGTLFISSSFEVPGEAAGQVITVADARSTRLHVWTM